MPKDNITSIKDKKLDPKRALMKRNITFLLIISFFAFPTFWLVNIATYVKQYKGISGQLLLTTFGVYAVFVFLLEIPTGVIADKVSRKLSILLGYFFSALGFLLFIVLPSIYGLIIFFLILGVGVSLISGAVESVLYDTLSELDDRKSYKRISSFMGFFSLVTGALYVYLGGFLIDLYGETITMYATVISYLIAFVLALFMTEPLISKEARKLNNDGYLKHTIKSIKLAFGSEAVKSGMLLLMIIYSIVLSIQTGLKYVIPIIAGDYGATKIETSSLLSIYLLAVGVSAMIFIGIWKGKIAYKLVIASILLFLALIVWIFNGSMSIAVYIVLVMSLSAPIITTIIDQRMNDDIKTDVRSSILSLRNMFARGVAGVLLPAFGWTRGWWGIEYAIAIIALWMFFALIGILIYWKTQSLNKFL